MRVSLPIFEILQAGFLKSGQEKISSIYVSNLTLSTTAMNGESLYISQDEGACSDQALMSNCSTK